MTAGRAAALHGNAGRGPLPGNCEDQIIITRPEPSEPGTGQARWASDRLISIHDIREIFRLGRTAAYELTHRAEFPDPIRISARCYRWWASEVDAFSASLRCQPAVHARSGPREAARRHTPQESIAPRRITGKLRAARTRKDTP